MALAYTRSIALSILMASACSKQSKETDLGDPSESPAPATVVSARESGEPDHKNDTKGEVHEGSSLTWLHDLDKAEALAKEQERDLIIDISAVWCAPCKELEEVTFADAAVAKRLGEDYVALNLDVSEQSAEDLALMKKFGVKLLPAVLVVRDTKILLTLRTFIGPRELEAKLDEIPARPATD